MHILPGSQPKRDLPPGVAAPARIAHPAIGDLSLSPGARLNGLTQLCHWGGNPMHSRHEGLLLP